MNAIQSLSLILCLFSLFGCGNYTEFKEDPSGSFRGISPSRELTFQEVKTEVFERSCTQCHSAYSEYDAVKSNLDAIVASVRSDRMPQNGPLTDEQKGLLFSWLAAGALEGDTQADQPPVAKKLEATYESINRFVIGRKCVACHSPSGQVPWVDLSTREAIWKQRSFLLDFESPEMSYMIGIIEDEFEPMPPLTSPFEQVTEEEVAVLKEWIRLGLP